MPEVRHKSHRDKRLIRQLQRGSIVVMAQGVLIAACSMSTPSLRLLAVVLIFISLGCALGAALISTKEGQ